MGKINANNSLEIIIRKLFVFSHTPALCNQCIYVTDRLSCQQIEQPFLYLLLKCGCIFKHNTQSNPLFSRIHLLLEFYPRKIHLPPESGRKQLPEAFLLKQSKLQCIFT